MASTYLSRASYGTPTSTKIFTFSCWVKKAKIGSGRIFDFYSAPFSYGNGLFFTGSDQLGLGSGDTGNGRIITSGLFRDTNAWYHIVAVQDTTNATASDRLKLYVNGERETSFSASVDAVLNAEYQAFRSDVGGIGTYYDKSTSSEFFDGEMAHIHFIDGTVYDASAFGETDATTGIWKPKTAPSVTYGTNGFFLKFENSGAMGTDSSGNSNNFTVNGTMTQTIDTPSNVFNVLNAVSNPPNGYTLSNGNLEATVSGQSFVRQFIANTIAPTSGKWYWESKLITSGGSDRSRLGICSYEENIGTGTTIPQNELSIATGTSRIRFTENGSTTEVDGFYTTPSANDIFMYALDLDNTKFYFGINGNWWNYNTAETGGDPTSGSGYVTNSTNIIKGAMSLLINVQAGAAATTFTNQFNFGNGYFGTTAVSSAQNPDDGIGIFEYDVPTGYYALNTKAINAQEYD